jgi:hypothetical protein
MAACLFEAVRAVTIARMQGKRPQGFNLAESMLSLALPSSLLLLVCSAAFEWPGAWHAAPRVLMQRPLLVMATGASSVLTDLSCFLALQVRHRTPCFPHV